MNQIKIPLLLAFVSIVSAPLATKAATYEWSYKYDGSGGTPWEIQEFPSAAEMDANYPNGTTVNNWTWSLSNLRSDEDPAISGTITIELPNSPAGVYMLELRVYIDPDYKPTYEVSQFNLDGDFMDFTDPGAGNPAGSYWVSTKMVHVAEGEDFTFTLDDVGLDNRAFLYGARLVELPNSGDTTEWTYDWNDGSTETWEIIGFPDSSQMSGAVTVNEWTWNPWNLFELDDTAGEIVIYLPDSEAGNWDLQLKTWLDDVYATREFSHFSVDGVDFDLVPSRELGSYWVTVKSGVTVASGETLHFSLGDGLTNPSNAHTFLYGARLVPHNSEPGQIIIDNIEETGYLEEAGSWSDTTETEAYGGAARKTSSTGGKASWNPILPADGMYAVYAQWGDNSNRDKTAEYEIHSENGVITTFANQNYRPGEWFYLGQYPMRAGTDDYVSLTRESDGAQGSTTCADAVKFELTRLIIDNEDSGFTSTGTWSNSSAVDKLGSSSLLTNETGADGTWTFEAPVTGWYNVYVWISSRKNPVNGTAFYTRDTNAKYRVNHKGGTETVYLDQNAWPGQWALLGTYEFLSEDEEFVKVIRTSASTQETIADGLKLERQMRDKEIRAAWVQNYKTEQQVTDTLDLVDRANVNTVFMNSKRSKFIDPSSGEDELDSLVFTDFTDLQYKLVHELRIRGISVHVWDSLYWIDENDANKDKHFLNHDDSNVRQKVAEMNEDFLDKMPWLDGSHLDYIRYASKWETGLEFDDPYHDIDLQKIAAVGNTVGTLREHLVETYPGKLVSAAVHPNRPQDGRTAEDDVQWFETWMTNHPWHRYVNETKPQHIKVQQDCATWAINHYLDLAVPFEYAHADDDNIINTWTWTSWWHNRDCDPTKLAIGVGNHRDATTQTIKDDIVRSRTVGVAGSTIFQLGKDYSAELPFANAVGVDSGGPWYTPTAAPSPLWTGNPVAVMNNNNPPATLAQNTTAGFTTSGAQYSSLDYDGQITQYKWEFTDDSSVQYGQNVQHTFSSTGTFDVILTVTDDEGKIDRHTHSIDIY